MKNNHIQSSIRDPAFSLSQREVHHSAVSQAIQQNKKIKYILLL